VNNLVSDAPVSRIDLILCRNVFIYLEADLQKRVLARFHFSLRREGVLVLGRSELIPFAARLFEPLDLSRRIYRKDVRHEPSLMRQERLVDLPEALPPASPLALEPPLAPPHLLREVFDSQACPYIVTDAEGIITQWNHAAARLWNRNEAEVVGRKLASQGLPGLSPDLLVEQSARVRAGRSERELDATNRELAHRTAEMDALSFCQRTIIRTLSEAVLVLDPNGRITTWNLAAERLLGITEREVVGQSLWTLSIPALKRPLIQRLRKSLLDHRSLRLEEVPYQLPHGGRGSATVVATPLISETTVLGFVILLEDTTRLTALQQEVREFKERPKR
jgi:PAS domain S-box-containing protein